MLWNTGTNRHLWDAAILEPVIDTDPAITRIRSMIRLDAMTPDGRRIFDTDDIAAMKRVLELAERVDA